MKFRNYTPQPGITENYYKVREFLLNLGNTNFTYARWDWMTTHGYLDKSAVGKIGLWEEGRKLVGVATFDTQLGSTYILTDQMYDSFKKEMIVYAQQNLVKDNKFGIVIPDEDVNLQGIASQLGYVATEGKEHDAIFYIDKTPTNYTLPEGFTITSMKERYDLYQYYLVLWKGFNHELNGEGEFSFSTEKEAEGNLQMKRPNVDLNLKIAVVAPNENLVSYCGMWYDPQVGYGVIEPVATDPEYRKMGLGKAAVLEGVKRVAKLGAKTVLVGSSQSFYYQIGMRPYKTATVWILK